MMRMIAVVLLCCLISGCANLMRAERDRVLDEKYRKGKIDKLQYYMAKQELDQEQGRKADVATTGK